MEHFGLIVDNKSHSAGGKPSIITPGGTLHNEPPHIDVKIPADANVDEHSHVFIVADLPWDPLVLDNKFDEEFCDTVTQPPEVQEWCDRVDPCNDGCGFL